MLIALRMVPPPSCTSAAASSFCRSKMAIATFWRISPRSCGDLLRQTPLSCAFFAAATARRASSRSATATVAQGSSVAGLMVGAVLPPFAASH
jgi:hypothetical protein